MSHPIPDDVVPGFGGTIRRTMAGSDPWWPPSAIAPEGAPNIVFVLVDDVGFADIGCFGGEIRTPNLDDIASRGVRFTNFHVNPMCSPTRASLLTGLNATTPGWATSPRTTGLPRLRAELAEDAATAAETLRANGYATFMVGKWHLCRDADMSSSGPALVADPAWFDRYYGILEAFTNLHEPHRLVQDNSVVDVDQYPDDFFLTDALTDQAISMIRDNAASRPGQPFFLYMAHPAAHAPLHAKAEDIEAYRDAYDAGWDEIRRQRHQRQIDLGIIAPGTVLPPRNSERGNDVLAWDELDDDRRRLFARYMAVYAAMVDEIDQSVGRLRSALEEMGQWDNTLFVFLSDNGASREGEATGTTNYFAHLGTGADTVALDLARLDEIGSASTMPHYPRGWAMAGNTPFRLYKRNTHAGGTRSRASCPGRERNGRVASRPGCARSTPTASTSCRPRWTSQASRHSPSVTAARRSRSTAPRWRASSPDPITTRSAPSSTTRWRATGASTATAGRSSRTTTRVDGSTTTSGSSTTCGPIRPRPPTGPRRCPTRWPSCRSGSTRPRSRTRCTAGRGQRLAVDDQAGEGRGLPRAGDDLAVPTGARTHPLRCVGVAAHRDDHDRRVGGRGRPGRPGVPW